MASQNTPRPTKAERTAQARDRVRQMREAEQRKQKRNSLLVRWGVVAAVVAIVAIIAVIVASNQRGDFPDAGSAPAHGNQYGGITLTSSTELATTEATTVDVNSVDAEAAPPAVPSGVAAAPKGEPAQIVVYVDAACSHCATFEATYGDQLKEWLDNGDATVEYRAVAFLDQPATGNYSSRGANAMACVADSAPQSFLPFVELLFERQVPTGMDSDALADLAAEAGADGAESCISDGTYRPYAEYTDTLARADGVGGTPAVYVDGKAWDNTGDFVEFAQPILDARA